MCGIAGVYNIKNHISDHRLLEEFTKKMLARLSHRGPEIVNIRTTKLWSMGIARLSIIDLANKNNIFEAANGKITFVVNGEIFNYKELREDLIRKGYVFRSHCDSEVVGFLYEEHGLDFINMLNGQFGIAIIDEIKNKILLIRDHFGIVPLFYYFNGSQCYFSSEIRGFGAVDNIPKLFNPKALDQLFTFWTTTGNTTFLQNIYQVRPSHYVEIDANGVREKAYYNLDLSREKIITSIDFDETKERVRALLTDAIKIRLESSDVEVGTYLSGGVDSSIVTKICKALKRDRLQTFSVYFTDPLYDEKKFQESFLSETNVVSNYINISYRDIVDNFEDAIDHAGQPIFRTAPVPLFRLSELAHNKKIKVVLTGEGADEVFWGYDIFKELKVRRFWAKRPSSDKRSLLFKKLYPQFPHFDAKYHAFISSFYKKALLSDDEEFYSHLVRWENGIPLKAMYSDRMKESVQNYDCIDEFRAQLPDNFKQFSDGGKCQYLEMQTLLPGYLLSSQGDRMSSAHSVESRIPYLDRRIVEFCACLPEQFKLHHFVDKYILRETFKEILPAAIYSRSKQAYQAPELTAFAQYAKGSYVEYLMSEEVTKTAGIFDQRRIGILLEKVNNAKGVSRVSTRDNMAFIQALSTHIFYSKYIHEL
ncbi:MAG: asparagine synthase (glutamine-hydrolyzing) [Candidatus Omnitrophica bacterium]|nr:asparagine synthase (glutamine-hydrolyzing) [Candidatus Omnitrophota bacterium]